MADYRPSRLRTKRAKSSDNNNPSTPSTKEMVASLAATVSPSGDCSAVYRASGSVRVSPGMFETNVITAPNSPRPAAKAVTAPAMTPGNISGNVIVAKRSTDFAPNVLAASSSPRSTPSSDKRIARTISGNDITAVANAAPAVEKISWIPNVRYNQPPAGPRIPNNSSKRYPTTTGGSTSGKWTNESSNSRPGKLRRVRSQAMPIANGKLHTTLRDATLRLSASACHSGSVSNDIAIDFLANVAARDCRTQYDSTFT